LEKSTGTIFSLSKASISTSDVVSYLENLNVANNQILKVLQKKPVMPEWEKLPWVIESKIDKSITSKLRNNKSLNLFETSRLKVILNVALVQLKNGNKKGLQKYLSKLEN